MPVSFRPGEIKDFDYCSELYFAGRDRATLDMAPLIADLRERWVVAQVRIVMRDGIDVGWLQTRTENDAIFIVQLFIEGRRQGQGIGTEVMHRMVEEAGQVGLGVTLGVVKTNPAFRLYTRMGFKITHEDERKFYMIRNA